MSLITWTPSLSVGVAEMDEQHKKLVKMINDLHDAMKAGKGKETLSRILSELASYTRTHFSAEEGHMARFKYADLASHKAAHAELIKKLGDVQKAQNEGQNVTLDVMKFLNSWLTDHIIGTDKKYAALFNQNGMK